MDEALLEGRAEAVCTGKSGDCSHRALARQKGPYVRAIDATRQIDAALQVRDKTDAHNLDLPLQRWPITVGNEPVRTHLTSVSTSALRPEKSGRERRRSGGGNTSCHAGSKMTKVPPSAWRQGVGLLFLCG